MTGNTQKVLETKTLLKLYQLFSDSTSMHGIGRVLNNSSRWKRVLWSMMFSLSLAFAIYQFVITMNDYYSYPVRTEVILQQQIKANFPGVTICNLNPRRLSVIDPEYEETLSTFGETEGFGNEALLDAVTAYAFKFNKSKSMHQISDMLTRCLFNRMMCSTDNFTKIDTGSYGACYTFEITLAEFISKPGPQNGLILELNIEHDEYLPTTSRAGMSVIVHPADEYPFPEEGGILAPPGAVTSIKVKKRVTHRLPAPYSTCVDASGQGCSQRNLYPYKKYMQKACINSCFQLTLYNECICCDPDLPCDYYNILNIDKNTIITNETHQEIRPCGDFFNIYCSYDVEVRRFRKGELNCDELCPPACDSTTFDTVVSSAQWPVNSRYNALLDLVNKSSSVLYNKSFADNASLELYIRSNFLRLEIFLDRSEFFEFTANAKYDWNLLLGTIGGLLGLYLGFSLLTAIEIVEVLIDTVLFYSRRNNREKTSSQVEQN